MVLCGAQQPRTLRFAVHTTVRIRCSDAHTIQLSSFLDKSSYRDLFSLVAAARVVSWVVSPSTQFEIGRRRRFTAHILLLFMKGAQGHMHRHRRDRASLRHLRAASHTRWQCTGCAVQRWQQQEPKAWINALTCSTASSAQSATTLCVCHGYLEASAAMTRPITYIYLVAQVLTSSGIPSEAARTKCPSVSALCRVPAAAAWDRRTPPGAALRRGRPPCCRRCCCSPRPRRCWPRRRLRTVRRGVGSGRRVAKGDAFR